MRVVTHLPVARKEEEKKGRRRGHILCCTGKGKKSRLMDLYLAVVDLVRSEKGGWERVVCMSTEERKGGGGKKHPICEKKKKG